MRKILIISGHPDLDVSHTNRLILARVAERVDEIEIRRLDALYPDYRIDVAAEQQALLGAGIVVLQFPFYWYSVPALLKKWMDEVLSYGFAYGSTGDKLKGKHLVLSITIGGPAASYAADGYNHFTPDQLLLPLVQTANLTGMRLQPPILSHGMIYIPGVYNTLEDVQARAEAHAERLAAQLRALRAEMDVTTR